MAGITILNHEFDIDFCDCEVLERYEQAMEMLRAEQGSEYSTATARLTAFCTVINKCMDHVLGEGAAELLFGGKMNYRTSTEAMVQLINAQKAATEEVQGMMDEMERTFQGIKTTQPNREGNREQRRAAAQGKHQNKKGKRQNYPAPVLKLPADEE